MRQKSHALNLLMMVFMTGSFWGCGRGLMPIGPTTYPTVTFTPTMAVTVTYTTGSPTVSPVASAGTPTSVPTIPITFTQIPTSTFTNAITYTSTVIWTKTFTSTTTPTATPTLTATETATPHRTPTYTSSAQPGIVWQGAYVVHYFPSELVGASMFLSVNGSPESTASVVLTTPNGPVTLNYASAWGSYGSYYATAPVSYLAGFDYTLTTITSIGTASATLKAPGGNVIVAPDGSSVSWGIEGNEDMVQVYGPSSAPKSYASNIFTSDLVSPFLVPSSAFTTAGSYDVHYFGQNTTYSISGTTPGTSWFTVSDNQDFKITR